MRAALLVTLGLALVGCQRFERLDQCRLLSQTMNPRLERIERRTHGAPPTRQQDWQALGTDYDQLARDLGRLRFADESLTRQQDSLVAVFQAASASALDAARATEGGESLGIERGVTLLRGYAHRQRNLVDGTAILCR